MSSLVKLRIVSINDVYALGNLPRLQTYLTKLKPRPAAVVLAGDFISPSTLSSIDGGRGMVSTLRATGLTHVSLGNHEQDVKLDILEQRLTELTKSVQVLNTNMREDVPKKAEWMNTITKPYSIIQSECGKVKVALMGILSDEPGIFRDNTFKGIPIGNVIDNYVRTYQEIVPNVADFCIPLTHSSLLRDKELAEEMLDVHQGNGLIIGGHEHDPYDESVEGDEGTIRIVKSGMDAQNANLMDLTFEISEEGTVKLAEIDYDLVSMRSYEPSVVVQALVDKHESVVKAFEYESIIDAETSSTLQTGEVLSSRRTRYQQTTLGGVFCQMIKEEKELDAVVINGATIKGDTDYPQGTLTYANIKQELPFPTRMVFIPMPRYLLDQAIQYSRTNIENGSDPEAEEVPRRGYLQTDLDYERQGHLGSPTDILKVGLPRNLLEGFCKIQPLMEVGDQLKKDGLFPGKDDFIPAIGLIVRNAYKNRWFQVIRNLTSFEEWDLNGDGILDRDEIKAMMKHYLGREPADFVVDDMISAIDLDGNGTIDQGEISFMLAQMERDSAFL